MDTPGYSGDKICKDCSLVKWGQTIKAKLITKVDVKVTALPVFDQEITTEGITVPEGVEIMELTWYNEMVDEE